MSKPLLHSESSVRKFRCGTIEDFLPIHDWFDQSKAHFPDARHRALLHSSFGIYICEQVFGTYITTSDGKKISVRDIGEQHVIEDMGFIPTVQDYLEHLEYQEWMNTGKSKKSCGTSHKKIQQKEEADNANKKTTIINWNKD